MTVFFKADHVRSIDATIDYFGDARGTPCLDLLVTDGRDGVSRTGPAPERGFLAHAAGS